MIACAAMMHDDMIAVAKAGRAGASFCPTSGSSGGLAKWNGIVHPACTSGGRHATGIESPDGARSL
jgi:hypothetical protein